MKGTIKDRINTVCIYALILEAKTGKIVSFEQAFDELMLKSETEQNEISQHYVGKSGEAVSSK